MVRISRNHAMSWLRSRVTLRTAIATLAVGIGVVALYNIHAHYTVTVPDYGGTLTEGIIGVPRFINPLIAVSDADRDLVALVYSGLMATDSDGSLVPDLAERYTLSDDGTVYTFTLRDDAVFHDGTPVTAHDVAFTVTLAQNDLLKSPKRPNWEGVRAEALDDLTVVFTLSEPFTPFITNTTLGVLPRHLWSDISPELIAFSNYNTFPVGSGPFRISSVDRDSNGIPYSFLLSAFDDYTRGRPYLDAVRFNVYSDALQLRDAYTRGAIDATHAISIPDAASAYTVPLARTFAVYFNQDFAPLFTNGSIRRALNAATNRTELVSTVFPGTAAPVTEPMPAETIPSTLAATSSDDNIAAAEQILSEANWEIDPTTGILTREFDGEVEVVSFTLATADIPELVRTAEYLQDTWATLGIDVTIDARSIAELNSQVIRPREYDALLFGQVVRAPHDLFAFWHSSQRNDPGLNVALYANIEADAALARLRTTTDPATVAEEYDRLRDELESDIPALFLYTPAFVYHIDPHIRGVVTEQIGTPSDRFSTIHEWYRYTQNVWPVFTSDY